MPSNSWGFNFRTTEAYLTDPANTTYVLPTDTAASRSIGADTVSFGWNTTVSSRNRSVAAGKLGGFHWSEDTGPSAHIFTVTLDVTGVWSIRLAFGDETDGPHDMSAVEIRDNGSTLYTFAEQSAANFIDANGTNRANAAAWASGNVARQLTFSTTTFQLYCPYGSSKDYFLSHLELTFIPAAGQPLVKRQGGIPYSKGDFNIFKARRF